jgi:hypothetical protein
MNYVVIESHPNMGSYWVGTLGDKKKVIEYLKKSDLDYVHSVLELKEKGEDVSKKFLNWDSRTFGFFGLNSKI